MVENFLLAEPKAKPHGNYVLGTKAAFAWFRLVAKTLVDSI